MQVKQRTTVAEHQLTPDSASRAALDAITTWPGYDEGHRPVPGLVASAHADHAREA